MVTSDILALAGLIVVIGISTIGLSMNILKSLARLDEKVDGTLAPRLEALEKNDAEHYITEHNLDKRITVIETQHSKNRA